MYRKNTKIINQKRSLFHAMRSANGGFTFVELIMVLAIFGIFTSIIVFNYSNFNGAITLQNLAHDIALQINQVQKTAISGANNPLVGFWQEYHPRYGVYFQHPSNNAQTLSTPEKLQTFA